MFTALILVAAQPVIVERMETSPNAILAAEIVERPAGTSPRDAIAALAVERGASGWTRSERVFDGPPFPYLLVGFRNPVAPQAVLFYARPGEETAEAGRLCRVSVRDPAALGQGDELTRISAFCIRGIAPLPVVTIDPGARRTPPQP